MILRRSLLAISFAVLLCPLGIVSASAEPVPLRVASVKFGTLGWLLETIKAEGLDKKHGLDLRIVDISNNQSSPIALYGGSADVVVSDWTWALRQRGMGEDLRFAPFSSSLGAVMVPEGSSIKTLADLEGKKLGVAGSAVDKSWLLLRAYTKKMLGKDLADLATPQYGAAPLLAEQLRDGRLDAVLNFWTFAARLEGTGFRRVISIRDVIKELGVDPPPALVGFIWQQKTEQKLGAQIKALLAAAAEGNAILASSDAAWERLRPLVKATSDKEFAALKSAYVAGVPGPWTDGDMQSAEKIMNLLIEGGDTELVGHDTRFDRKLFQLPGT